MWYFSWILGLGLALTFGVLNAIWYEVREIDILPRLKARDSYGGPQAASSSS
jgi:cyd operon protein YbgT